MSLPDSPTIAFNVWPNMAMVEGPSSSIALLIKMLYDDKNIARDAWTVQHKCSSRAEYAQEIAKSGAAKRRQGVGVKDTATVKTIEGRCKALGLSFFLFAAQTGS